MEKVRDAIIYGAEKCGYSQVREQQRQVVEAYLCGRDVFMSAHSIYTHTYTNLFVLILVL